MSDFWSRRKAAAREAEAAEAAEAAEREAARAEAAEAAALDALPEAEQLERLGLPDPDAVASGDDVRAFLARRVPRAIRDRALRSLWRSNPVLACRDGLNDYDGDFTGDGLRGGTLRTAYAVGKGLMTHLDRVAAVQPERISQEYADENDQVNLPQATEKMGLVAPAPIMERLDPEAVPEEGPAPVTAPPAPIRRMRFTFEEDREE